MISESEKIIIKTQLPRRQYSGTGTMGGINCPCSFLRGEQINLDYERKIQGQVTNDCPFIYSIRCTKQDGRVGYIYSIHCTKQENLTGTIGTILENKFFWKCPYCPCIKFVYHILKHRITCSTTIRQDIYNERIKGTIICKLSLLHKSLFLITMCIEKNLGQLFFSIYRMEEIAGTFVGELSLCISPIWGYRRPVK